MTQTKSVINKYNLSLWADVNRKRFLKEVNVQLGFERGVKQGKALQGEKMHISKGKEETGKATPRNSNVDAGVT